ncbi:L-ascorbate metabolism protein UlaG (beta-lactamase superfamily) [Allocatelliglobosispora scoriae]|uniref:L-ascorbate metabolism protein UlaG (Beta-lactamase superfamily) n=1 Tax=Allocatelliglobosispora scoriae TaxID=643052 RepID=A0A841BLJ5_9ACTN|nr:MBL fold metallo-hydrolase [Allocatelliglobosispora scoriae]MBB5869957.1 L-ascorbate metabolism protein UlaG (beta-lactamase superfamily) [Allocatelliglobosispora scoriae]
MRLIKYTHACVRVEHEGRHLVIDPGVWAEPAALQGVSDVLVTHEHFDHVNADTLAAAIKLNPVLKVYTHQSVAEQLAVLGDAIVAVAPGETFTAAGFTVRVVGGEHAEIYDGLPGCANIGFIIDENVYHPGDSFFVPQGQVQTLLVPASAPWLKLSEALDFARAVKPARAIPIHDAMLSQLGLDNFDRWMGMKADTEYSRVPIGGSIEI